MKKKNRKAEKINNDKEIYCPDCGGELKTVVGEREDCSFGEYQECPDCGWIN